jgi:restriction system protein
MTIVDAIRKVLHKSDTPMTPKQIYHEIVAKNLYSFAAKSPEHVVSSILRKHTFGLDFPSASPRKVFVIDSRAHGNIYYKIWNGKQPDTDAATIKAVKNSDYLPEEILQNNYESHLSSVKSELLDYIHSSDPAFFEKLVLDLLLRMGYGWNSDFAGIVVGGAGDHGIDGIINEDKLGLESIYIQAKRYTKNSVSPNEVREFIGSMSLKGARKGVFFSSSKFTAQAKAHAKESTAMKITLIDGDRLCDLLLQHGMGVVKIKEYSVFSVDKNFFQD